MKYYIYFLNMNNSNIEEENKLIIKILFDAISTDLNEKTKGNQNNTKSVKIDISKKVPRWSTNLWTN